MTLAEMWREYRDAMGCSEEEEYVFYAGAESCCAKVAQDADTRLITGRRFDPRRAAIALDAVHTEAVVYRNRKIKKPEPAGKPS